MNKALAATTVAALLGTVLLAGAARCSRPDRPPAPLTGAWSYSTSESHDGSSRSESLSVCESAGSGPGYADVRAEEMVNGVMHTARQGRVRYRNVSGVLDRLVAQAKRGL